jgi:hypothetical protein
MVKGGAGGPANKKKKGVQRQTLERKDDDEMLVGLGVGAVGSALHYEQVRTWIGALRRASKPKTMPTPAGIPTTDERC